MSAAMRARSNRSWPTLIARAMRADAGSLLAFLPGAAEIRRTQALLESRVDATTDVVALYGALGGDEQDRAIAPAPPGRRKVVLATSIAETSITIEGVRIVVDSGLARVPRYEPDVGADAARNRARVARGGGPAPRPRRPHRARRLLSALGRAADRGARTLRPARNPRRRSVVVRARPRGLGQRHRKSSPSSIRRRGAALAEAKALLAALGAIDRDGRITEEGRSCAGCRCRRGSPAWWSMPPAKASRACGAEIAALIGERGLGGDDVDLRHRLDALAPRPLAARAARPARWRNAGRRLRHRWSSEFPPHQGPGNSE